MRVEVNLFAFAILMLLPITSLAQADQRKAAAERLTLALTTADTPAQLRDAARVVAAGLPETSRIGRRLARVATRDTGFDRLSRALRSLRNDLAFTRVAEAELPEGFPEPTPVGEIIEKRYPSYRLARTSTVMGETGDFWVLFAHISSNDIPMTAPVEMTYSDGRERRDMAFLYREPTVGEAGKSGLVDVVDVVDVAPMRTVAIGLRGKRGARTIEAARRALDEWIADRGDLETCGEMRVMGYNSPSVPNDRKYYEVEIPVKDKPRPGSRWL